VKGHFVISLDYEIHWGVFDKKSVQDYHENLSSVNFVIDRLLELSNRYDVKLTFSTVGLLFAENKEDLILHSPRQKPSYSNTKFNPYNLISDIGNSERDDPFHYALSGIQKIKNTIKDYDIVVCMTNKDSQKITKPIIDYLDEK
jgi:hypothetical protein